MKSKLNDFFFNFYIQNSSHNSLPTLCLFLFCLRAHCIELSKSCFEKVHFLSKCQTTIITIALQQKKAKKRRYSGKS